LPGPDVGRIGVEVDLPPVDASQMLRLDGLADCPVPLRLHRWVDRGVGSADPGAWVRKRAWHRIDADLFEYELVQNGAGVSAQPVVPGRGKPADARAVWQLESRIGVDAERRQRKATVMRRELVKILVVK